MSALVHRTPQHTSAEPCKRANKGEADEVSHFILRKALVKNSQSARDRVKASS